jgi:hypothetical protein
MTIRGARYLHILVPCPLGWGSASHDTIKLARLARETGFFPEFEAEHGEVTQVTKIRQARPGGRLFEAPKAFCAPVWPAWPPETIARIQADADRNIRRYHLLEEGQEIMTMKKPFAITLDPGSSLANKTGSWRTERPVYVSRLPPCNAQCPPGKTSRLAVPRREWRLRIKPGATWWTRDNPFPAIMGRVCYHSCEGACNRATLDSAVGINSVERFLGDEALKRGWKFAARARVRQSVLVVGAGPSGMSAAYHLRRLGHAVNGHGSGPVDGRHDALWHSQIPPAARCAGRRRCSALSIWA